MRMSPGREDPDAPIAPGGVLGRARGERSLGRAYKARLPMDHPNMPFPRPPPELRLNGRQTADD